MPGSACQEAQCPITEGWRFVHVIPGKVVKVFLQQPACSSKRGQSQRRIEFYRLTPETTEMSPLEKDEVLLMRSTFTRVCVRVCICVCARARVCVNTPTQSGFLLLTDAIKGEETHLKVI